MLVYLCLRKNANFTIILFPKQSSNNTYISILFISKLYFFKLKVHLISDDMYLYRLVQITSQN